MTPSAQQQSGGGSDSAARKAHHLPLLCDVAFKRTHARVAVTTWQEHSVSTVQQFERDALKWKHTCTWRAIASKTHWLDHRPATCGGQQA